MQWRSSSLLTVFVMMASSNNQCLLELDEFIVGISQQLTRRSLNLEIVKNVHASMMHYADISYMLVCAGCITEQRSGPPRFL